MAKETKELYQFAGTTTNAGYGILEDGKFGFNDDLARVIPVLLEAQPGLTGIKEVKVELANATTAEKDANLKAMQEKMLSVPESDRYDISQGLHGFFCWYSLAVRAGIKEGRAQLAAELKAGIITIEEL